jgi:CMP-N,N'-diacetyllegionaminic acid synthase
MIYVFDLDHTLCDTKKKDDGNWDYLNSTPYQDRIEKVNRLFDDGNKIIIETARGNSSKINWYLNTHNQLVSWGLKFHELRTGVKYGADFYIDDKGINAEVFFRG